MSQYRRAQQHDQSAPGAAAASASQENATTTTRSARDSLETKRRNEREANRIHCRETRERKREKERLLREVNSAINSCWYKWRIPLYVPTTARARLQQGTSLGMQYTYACLSALRAWIMLLIDRCDRAYSHCAVLTFCSIYTVSSHIREATENWHRVPCNT